MLIIILIRDALSYTSEMIFDNEIFIPLSKFGTFYTKHLVINTHLVEIISNFATKIEHTSHFPST